MEIVRSRDRVCILSTGRITIKLHMKEVRVIQGLEIQYAASRRVQSDGVCGSGCQRQQRIQRDPVGAPSQMPSA